MFEQKPVLTIAIPTWNRAKMVGERLEEIKLQYDSRIIVLVSDNASEDETLDVIAKYQRDMPYLVSHRNVKNLGFDGNILKLYHLAKTPYIWFLGSDDRLENNAVQVVLNSLDRLKPVVMVGKSIVRNDLGVFVSSSDPEQVYDDLSVIPDYALLTRPIFISGLIIRKDGALNTDELETYTNTGFFHLTLALLLLDRCFRLILLNEPLVQRRAEYYSNSLLMYRIFVGCYYAVELPGTKFDVDKFKGVFLGGVMNFFRLLMASKIGVFEIEGGAVQPKVIAQIMGIYGFRSMKLLLLIIVYLITPKWSVKLFFLIKQVYTYGWVRGWKTFLLRMQPKVLEDKDSLKNSR